MESLAAGLRSAISSSIQAADRFKSDSAEISTGETPTNHSPPYNSTIIDFVPPPRHGPPRVRPAAHLVDDEYLKKYEKAIELMRALPDDDPRSFTQQANLYRAYRDGDYEQIGIPKLDLQVHSSWFFAPWHRFFLYFHERILGKLIGDDNFAIPFWNWDSPEGMARPAFYTEKFSSIHNKNGNPNHQSTVLVDFDGSTNVNFNELEHFEDNLKIMYRHMICNGKTAHNFLGAPYRAGDEPSHGSGALERIPHVRIENSGNSNFEDMGNFYDSGRDKVFYGQHANVDRYWSVWNTGGINQGNFDDPEWLDSAFYFYDENKQLVRVKLSDCLDTQNLGYEYQQAEIPWLDKRPTPRMATTRLLNKNAPVGIGEPVFPITLDKPVSVMVKRPKRRRSRREEDDEEEVLLVEEIVVGQHEFKFDVYINPSEEEKKLRPSASEFAGSFSVTPRKHHYGQDRKTNLRLGITDLVEDLGAENDDSVVVTLVPRIGNGNNKETVGGLRIEFSS